LASAVNVVAPVVLLGEFRVHGHDPLHALMRAARTGEAAAVAEVLDQVRRQAAAVLPAISGGVVVPVPSHLPDTVNPMLDEAAAVLAATQGWTFADGALVRRHPAPEAKVGPARSEASEVASLEWTPPPGQAIVLLDDVVRSGATFRVCAAAIQASGDARPIAAVALARAIDEGD
jgi:predicted amidophosphoribosyltransferase